MIKVKIINQEREIFLKKFYQIFKIIQLGQII